MSAVTMAKKLNKKTSANGLQSAMILPGEELKKGIWPRSIPLWMAAFYMALFIIRPWEKLLPLLQDIYFERAYALCMLTALFFTNKKQFRMGLQSLAIVLFFFALAVSSIFAWDSSLAREVLYEYMTVIVFYFVLIMVIRTAYELRFMVTSYIVIMTVYLAKSQWEFFIHGEHRADMGVHRLCGIETSFGGPNVLAMSIVVSLPILFYLWSVRKQFSETWPKAYQVWFPRVLVFYSFLAISSIIFTYSRSGMLSVILVMTLTTFGKRGIGRKLAFVLLGVMALVSIWFIMPEDSKNRFQSIWDPTAGPQSAQVSAQGRIEGLKAGMKMFERSPLTGVGIGNFIVYRVKYVDGIALNPHNLAGQLLGETGLLGAGAFLMIILVALLNYLKVRALSKRCQDLKDLSDLVLACRNGIIILLFEGLFGHNGYRYQWLWMAAFILISKELIIRRRRKNVGLV